jgi:hypothetical protein
MSLARVSTCSTLAAALAAALALAAQPYALLSVIETNRSVLLVLSTPTPGPTQQIFCFPLPFTCAHTHTVIAALLVHRDIINVVFSGSDALGRIREVIGVEATPVLDLQMVEAVVRDGRAYDDVQSDAKEGEQWMDSETLLTFGTRLIERQKARTRGRTRVLELEECAARVLMLRGNIEELIQDVVGEFVSLCFLSIHFSWRRSRNIPHNSTKC